MVQEATVICIDNSEWMRNGDYSPTRFQAQAEAVNLICGAKTQSNPENTVGILTMAGKGVRVLVNLTTDLGKILACMHGLEVGGEMNLTSGVQVAQLALKHRQNKHQRQRIIVFAGSPIASDKKTLESIGKRLKKNNVALDIVDFGEEEGGKAEKLDALLTSVNSNDNSHIVHVEPGPNILSDVLISTPIFTGDGEGGSGFAAAAAAGAAAAAAGGGGAFEFGVDPNLDPELALALRVSMEEERARQEAAARRAAEDSSTKAAPGEGSGTAADVRMTEASSGGGAPDRAPDLMDDDTALLEQALNMSMAEAGSGLTTAGPVPSGDLPMLDASVEDPDLAMALRLSMEEEAEPSQVSQVLGDRGFMSSILATLPGVDPNDPSVRDVLASLQQQGEDPKKDEPGSNTNSNK